MICDRFGPEGVTLRLGAGPGLYGKLTNWAKPECRRRSLDIVAEQSRARSKQTDSLVVLPYFLAGTRMISDSTTTVPHKTSQKFEILLE